MITTQGKTKENQWIKRWRELVGNSDVNQEASLLMILDEYGDHILREKREEVEKLKCGANADSHPIDRAQDRVLNEVLALFTPHYE